MTVTIYGIKNCGTMQKAFKWLGARSVAYDFHDYRKAGVTTAQLLHWCRAAGWQTVLNRAGTTFRKLGDADKQALTEDKAIALMADHPSMIKRPILDVDGKLEIGFRPERYAALFGA
jgi:arsenate reductase (glutaredoxin)